MTRIEPERVQTNCKVDAYTGSEDIPTSCDLSFKRGGKCYILNIAIPSFLKGLTGYNKQFDPDLRLSEKFFIMDSIPSLDKVCAEISKIPLNTLKPYLAEQNDQITDQR